MRLRQVLLAMRTQPIDRQFNRFGATLCSALTCAAIGLAGSPELDGVKVTYLDGGRLYSCAFDSGNRGTDWVKLEVRNAAGELVRTYRLPSLSFKPQNRTLRWHIGGGCFWATGQEATLSLDPALRVPLSQIGRFELTTPKPMREESARSKDGENVTLEWNLTPGFNLWQAEIPVRSLENFQRRPVGEICYDFLPTSSESCLLFILHESEMRVFDGKRQPMPKSSVVNKDIEYRPLARFQLGVQELFNVFSCRDKFVFVTRSGRLYFAKRGGKERSVNELWKDADWPIVAAVVDVGSNTTFFLAQEIIAVPGRRKVLWLDKNERLAERIIDPAKMEPLPFGRPLETCLPFFQYLKSEGLLPEKRP